MTICFLDLDFFRAEYYRILFKMSKSYKYHPLSTTLKKFYLNTDLADVHFVLSSEDHFERVPAHKMLLAFGSDVFKAMFYGDLKEGEEVQIIDASATAFKEFLQFFYLSSFKISVENVYEVLNLGRKYQVVACVSTCEAFLIDSLSTDNVCSIYGLAIHFDLDDLKGLCETKIVADTETVLQSIGFLECDRSVLGHILKLDAFSCAEMNVFHASVAWARAKAQRNEASSEMIRYYLGDLFHDIRFGSMTIQEFSTLLPSYGNLFTIDEYQEIIRINASTQFRSELFNQNPRQAKWNKDAALECIRASSGSGSLLPNVFCHLDTVSSIFSTSKPFLLGEFVHVEMKLGRSTILPSEITITRMDKRMSVLIYKKAILVRSGQNRVIRLAESVVIKPGFKYKVQLKRFSNWCCDEYKIEMLKKELEIGPEFTIFFHDDAESNCEASNGLITALRINRISTRWEGGFRKPHQGSSELD